PGGGRMAGAVPPVLVPACRRPGAAPGPAGKDCIRQGKETQEMNRDSYAPAPAFGARVQKDGDRWTLVLVRELRHAPAMVWDAITDPQQLRQWAPFDADRNLGRVGSATLTTVGAPTPQVSETRIKRADAARALEYNWGDK